MKLPAFQQDRKQDFLIRDLQEQLRQTRALIAGMSPASGGNGTGIGSPTTSVTMGGEVTGDSSNAVVSKIIGKPVTTDAPVGGQYLEYNAVNWYPRTGWMKMSARAAVDSNVTISSPGSTLDGLAPVAGETFLLFGQTDATQNGLYTWFGASEPMVRRYDCDSGGNFVRGFVVTVVEGSYQSQLFVCTAADDIDVGTDSVTFSQVSAVVKVRKNSTGSVYARPRLNFVEDVNVEITIADDPTDKEIDITFGSFLVVREVDGSPSINGTILEFPNGTVTNPSGSIVRYTPAASAITIEEVDGTPSIAAATTLRVQNTFLSNPSSGVALLDFPVSIPVVMEDGTVGVDEGGNVLMTIIKYSEFVGL